MNVLILLFLLIYLPLQAAPEAFSQGIESILPSQAFLAKKDSENLSSEQSDTDWKLEEYFGSVVVINLPHCTERLASVTDRLKEIGCNRFDVFKAVNGRTDVPDVIWNKFCLNWGKIDLSTEEGKKQFDNQRRGEAGCYLSHYGAVKEIKDKFDRALLAYREAEIEKNEERKTAAYRDLLRYRSVLIVEDDTGFGIRNPDGVTATLKGTGKIFRSAMAEMPDDWDMFYFMTYSRTDCPNEPYKPHLIKLNCSFSAIAYVVNHTIYDKILEKLAVILDPFNPFLIPVDSLYANFHATCRCYAVIPSIAYQGVGMSTINAYASSELIQFQPFPAL